MLRGQRSFNFRDSHGAISQIGRRLPDSIDIRGPLHKELADDFALKSSRSLKAGAILFGERAGSQIQPRRIPSLGPTQFAADANPATDRRLTNRFNLDLGKSIVREQELARLDKQRQGLKINRDTPFILFSRFGTPHKRLVGDPFHRFTNRLPDMQLRTVQISKDREPSAFGPRGRAQTFHTGGFLLRGTM